jgi:hypothetical protein
MDDKKPPNPNGKKGGEKHQNKTSETAAKIEAKDLIAKKELEVDTPQGKKTKRYVDVAALDLDRKVVELYQVGKTNKNGTPVKREQEAIADIEAVLKMKVQFLDYNE